MLINYLNIALRNIRRNKLYSFINIGCLAIGIAVALTILLYTLHERSYDRWQANARRIFIVDATVHFGKSSFNTGYLSYGAGPLVQQADEDVEAYLRILPVSYQPVALENPSIPGASFSEKDNFIFADGNFFSFFSFRLLRGNPLEVLKRPNTIVLTERMARKYFGLADPIGRTLRFHGLYTLEVTGVAADLPSNTGINFDFVAALSSISGMKGYSDIVPTRVQAGNMRTWLLLKNATDVPKVEKTLGTLAEVKGRPDDERDIYHLTSLANMHLGSFADDSANVRYLQIFPLAAGLVLLLALINYMSLATAQSTARAKEVGVRKVLGAGRGKIAGQFYIESAVIAMLSFAAGIGLFLLLKPWFFQLLRLRIDNAFLFSPVMLGFTGGLLVLVMLAAGSYPALVLSAFRPVAVLYGKMSGRRGGGGMRKGFIFFQFTISMILILCSFIIGKQLYFIRHTDTGIDRDNVVMVRYGNNLHHYTAFKKEIETLPGINRVSTALYPMYEGYNILSMKEPGSDREWELNFFNVDNDFISVLGLEWKDKPTDETMLFAKGHVVLNEAAVERLGLAGNPVGQSIKFREDYRVIAGVLKNFNYRSLQYGVSPTAVFVRKDTDSLWSDGGCLMAKIGAHVNIPTVLEGIKNVYRRYDSQQPFEYEFMDETFNNFYKAEDRLAGLSGLFTTISVIIACLGLFALATFAAQQRVKEIGIRKVLGASVSSIGTLLSRDFLRPVLLAVLVASPLSWWLMNKWLEDFAYRTSLSWWIFLTAGMGLLLVALATVLFRTIKAAQANPTINLRSE